MVHQQQVLFTTPGVRTEDRRVVFRVTSATSMGCYWRAVVVLLLATCAVYGQFVRKRSRNFVQTRHDEVRHHGMT